MILKGKPYFYSVLLAVMTLLICLCSPLHPFAKNLPGTDSSVFLLIGKYMAHGMMPYTDFFDHKGPLLYVINWLGMFVGFTGVWLIELVCIFLSVWFCYKTARRFFSEFVSFFGTIITFISLLSWYNGGNFTESYALPLLFIALYCLTGYFVQNFELNRIQVFVSGACLGGVLMLRQNIIGLWVGMCTVIFVHSLIIRKFKIILNILFFIAGIIISISPFIIWLFLKGALNDFYRCYFLFNFMYINVPLIDIIKSMYHIFSYPIIPIAAAIMVSILLSKKEIQDDFKYILNLSLIAMFVMTVLLSSLSGHTYSHYYLVFLPCLILPISWFSVKIIEQLKTKPVITLLVICFILNQSMLTGVKMFIGSMFTNNTTNILASYIKKNTKQDEPILYIGHYCIIYLVSERPPAGYYPYYTSYLMNYSLSNMNYIDELESKKPKLIACEMSELPKILEDYINNNYTVIYEYENHKICRLNDLA